MRRFPRRTNQRINESVMNAKVYRTEFSVSLVIMMFVWIAFAK